MVKMKKDDNCLINRTCIPCQSGMPALTHAEAEKSLLELGGTWMVNDKGYLYKVFKFPNFIDAIYFANKVAEIAEKEGHHPDLKISWGSCEIEIWTHKINGLTESDFILAAKIENLYA